MRQAFDKGFYMGGALASAMTVSKGRFPPKEYSSEPNGAHAVAHFRPLADVSRHRTAR